MSKTAPSVECVGDWLIIPSNQRDYPPVSLNLKLTVAITYEKDDPNRTPFVLVGIGSVVRLTRVTMEQVAEHWPPAKAYLDMLGPESKLILPGEKTPLDLN